MERCFSKLKQFRAVATRYDKRDYMYQGTVDVASIRIWLRDPVPDLRDTAWRVCRGSGLGVLCQRGVAEQSGVTVEDIPGALIARVNLTKNRPARICT